MRKTFTCPSCGADIIFMSLFSMYNTCSYCKSLVVKHGVDLESLGKISEFPRDLSPLQIGTTGTYNKVHFTIVGRQKVVYDKGFWNEWYICFEDGMDAWLADAQGFFMISKELAPGVWTLPAEDKIYVSQSIFIDKIQYLVDDIKIITGANFTGELPWYNSKVPKRKSIDLSNTSNSFANIEYYENEVKVFSGEYLEFDDLKFQNLREVDGW